jgi:hypothetical protein
VVERGTASPPPRSPLGHLWLAVSVIVATVVVIGLVTVAVVHGTSPGSAMPSSTVPPSIVSPSTGQPSAGQPPGGAKAQATSFPLSPPTLPGPTAPSTQPGPDGVRAAWVIAENQLPGTTSWIIPPATPAGAIAGFANLNYAAVGDTVKLYVTTASPTYHVVAYRMGWYQGKGARQVWASGQVAGGLQPPCPVTPGVNMVSCDNWTSDLSIPITAQFVQGDYLLKLVGTGGQEGYVPLTIWSPNSTATYLVINRTFTEEGWNAYGGYSFYQGEGPCPPRVPKYPVCNRARIVSLDRPFATGNGASDFLGNEYPLIQYMEREGLDVTYVTDVTLDADPQIALNHRVLISLGHDESWSYPERLAAVEAQAHGVNIVFFGAAAVLRNVRMQPSPLGPEREEVDYRDASEDPLDGHGNPLQVTGNTWGSPPADWSEDPFVGETYSGYLTGSDSVPFVVYDASAWIFQGTGLQDGSKINGVVMSDIDHLQPTPSMPQNLQVFGHSPVPLSMVYTNQGTWGPFTYSDMTYYTDPRSGAGVLDTGTVNWIAAMGACPAAVSTCGPDVVQQITGNVLRVFGQGPAGATNPAVANWQTVQPAGS